MKLVDPTDFEILEVMSEGKRQTAPNVAAHLDRKRQYMNDRLSALAGMGLVERVGPSKRSGMYVITTKGRVALNLRDQYSHADTDRFAELVENHSSIVEEQNKVDRAFERFPKSEEDN
ncbi:helix-turn-helix domain-containing protein [Halogranum rubrum]|uniref:Phage PhiH1 repressor protein n=1 Tax=Halogranum salarium B-1 TaxID=1210908 RepID=J3F0F9_9EURY|nr:helix-turn-helix transcriptional regulator [Halogranum salarium]EJN61567.1 phage PhiH1 repressor protein [Halogranum salarium B-1]